MQNYLLGILCVFCFSLPAQISLNMNLLGNWDDDSLLLRDGGAFSDIWGYAANGREYAIIASIERIYFFDITNPANIVEVAHFVGGDESIWRDIKTYGNYAYAVADEGDEGILVFDLSNLPNSVSLVNTITFIDRAHNIFIDQSTGRLYTLGADVAANGINVFDLTANPASPTLIASVALPGGYVHDAYIENNILYAHHGWSGMAVYNVSMPFLPQTLGTLETYTNSGYNHSGWVIPGGNYYVFADENHGRELKMANIADLGAISVVDLFSSTLEAPAATNSIAHNPFVLGNYCYVSYYHDGVQVFDISDPLNAQRVAYYDTYPSNTDYGGFFGAWGVYPYLPSGNIIASDILNGLFVLDLDENSLLPVKWGSFSARRNNVNVDLNWSTLSELDNAGFWVQRSIENGAFEDLFFVSAGSEASQALKRYQATDFQVPSTTLFYRLRQVDIDGQQSYSEIIRVDGLERTDNWQLVPNLLQAGQNSQLTGPIEDIKYFQCLNSKGQVMQGLQIQAGQLTIPSHFKPGWYQLLLETENGRLNQLSFIIQ